MTGNKKKNSTPRSIAAKRARQRGNIAMLFGLLLLPLVAAVGIAIDLGSINASRSHLQEAADGAVLAAARHKVTNPNATNAELTTVARKVWNGLTSHLDNVTIHAFAVEYDPVTDKFELDVDATSQTYFMRAWDKSDAVLDTTSIVKMGPPPPLEIAMALDVTGSMNDGTKLDDLKAAAKDLVTTIFAYDDLYVKFSLVPLRAICSHTE